MASVTHREEVKPALALSQRAREPLLFTTMFYRLSIKRNVRRTERENNASENTMGSTLSLLE